MTETLEVPFGSKTTQRPLSRRLSGRRQSHASYRSWISTLATPHLGSGGMSSPPPIPVTFEVHSPASTTRTVKLSQAPERKQPGIPEATESTESKEIPALQLLISTDTGGDIKEFDGQMMSPVEEGSEHPTTPTVALRGRARSLVDGLVSGIRSIPRAVTHSQLHDRVSLGRESSRVSHYTRRTASESEEYAYKFPNQPLPYGVPILLAPPFPQGRLGPPMTMSGPPTSKISDMDSRNGHRGFLGELNSLPWISSRVAVDYFPGVSRSTSVPSKSLSSWYTMTAPSSPSPILRPEHVLPDPWFAPTRLDPAWEVPEEEERAAEGDDGMTMEQKLEKTRDELQEKDRELDGLRQIVEHQKKHIGALEAELTELRKAEEVDLHRRKSSMRQSLRARDSIRASMRRTSMRVSRPSSSFFD
ncbi:hypothetical protein PHLCEN_2v13198 [Hermanssonia centrifuga]|uniref:Uncharacterized protein n=1 Tax=Hermanssonia centrifuga TaxID=98765 RepID=A0A2R6NEZ6_9APHY|nr:hypothetical protein PHLCEN_2v13198 [Hermanssonia centrifuga]